MTGVVVAALATLVAAALGAFLSHRSAQRLRRHEGQLARVDAQLRELYGPMYATLEANRIAYKQFLAIVRPGSANFFDKRAAPPDEKQLRLWREWMITVLQPGNEYIYSLLQRNAHLLLDEELPEFLLQFSAHVAGFRVTLKQWTEGDYSHLTSVVEHPREPMNKYAKNRFAELKMTQARLLRLTR